MTRQRQLIYKIIMNTEGHLSADEIFGYAKAEMPSIALGTVYRNLRLMVEDKEIRQIVTEYGPDRYDRNMIPHEHLPCDGCGGLKDLLESRGEITVLDYQLNIRGICPACKSKGKKAQVQ